MRILSLIAALAIASVAQAETGDVDATSDEATASQVAEETPSAPAEENMDAQMAEAPAKEMGKMKGHGKAHGHDMKMHGKKMAQKGAQMGKKEGMKKKAKKAKKVEGAATE